MRALSRKKFFTSCSHIADVVPDRFRDFLELKRFVVLGTVDSRHRALGISRSGRARVHKGTHTSHSEDRRPPLSLRSVDREFAGTSHTAMLAIDLLNPRRVRVMAQARSRDAQFTLEPTGSTAIVAVISRKGYAWFVDRPVLLMVVCFAH